MECINKGGTLVYGDGKGQTVFLRPGEKADVPDEVYAAHRDKLKPLKDVKDPGKVKEAEVMTADMKRVPVVKPPKKEK